MTINYKQIKNNRMKKRILIYIVFACLFCINMHAQVFVIERGTNTTLTFDNIKSAVDALADGDRLYIPSGTHNLGLYNWEEYDESAETNRIVLSRAVVINKKVAIYGGGYYGDNASALTNGTIVLDQNASGSYITGIRFENLRLNNVSNLNISRCRITTDLLCNGYGGNNMFSECDINTTTYYSSTDLGIIATKCIFHHSNQSLKSSTVKNSIFVNYSSSSWYFTNSYFYNNIFVIDKTKVGVAGEINGNDPNMYINNLFVGGELNSETNSTFQNNITKIAYTDTFVNGNEGNYHLLDNSVAKNAGTDGTDIGIYGTTSPFNDNRMPALPYFKVKVIGTETDATGKLPVEIIIEAQD